MLLLATTMDHFNQTMGEAKQIHTKKLIIQHRVKKKTVKYAASFDFDSYPIVNMLHLYSYMLPVAIHRMITLHLNEMLIYRFNR